MGGVSDAAIMGNGDVRFIQRAEAIPEKVEKRGTVTVHTVGAEAIPAHYEVTFSLAFIVDGAAGAVKHSLVLTVPVQNDKDHAAYREVEAQAAQQIAPILRDVADRIERQVADFELRRKTKDED